MSVSAATIFTPPADNSPVTDSCSPSEAATEVLTFSRQEVLALASADRWLIIIANDVYDVQTYAKKHPGGEDVLMSYLGRDSTSAFKAVGHSTAARASMSKYRVGTLQEADRVGEGL